MRKYLAVAAVAAATFVTGMSQAQTLRVGHILSETHPGHIALSEMSDALKEQSEGRMSLDVFANGILGTHLELISQVSSGALDMALIPGISPFQGLDARLGVEEIPFLFATSEEAYAAVDGAFGDKVTEILAGHNLKALSYWENGFRHFTNNTRPIVTVDDLAGIRFRSDTSTMRLAMFQEFGASAVSMSFAELFTGLQQGVVNGQENPLTIIASSNLYEVQEYLSLSGHLWGAAVLIINPAIFDRLDAADQELLQTLSHTYRDRARELITQGDQELRATLEGHGMKVNDVDKASFSEAAQRVVDLYVKTHGDELLKLIRN